MSFQLLCLGLPGHRGEEGLKNDIITGSQTDEPAHSIPHTGRHTKFPGSWAPEGESLGSGPRKELGRRERSGKCGCRA